VRAMLPLGFEQSDESRFQLSGAPWLLP